MGRRALPKIDPSLDIASHLKTLEDLPRPWDAAALFGRNAPLEVEIGAGKGLFLRTEAVRRPAVDFLGIEVAKKYAAFSAAALAKRGLRNAVMVAGDAVAVLRDILPDQSVNAIHVYFPDPWWKKRHRRRRVMREEVIHLMERRLLPGGLLHFWTDVEEYFHSTLELLAEVSSFEGPFDVAESEPEHDLDYRTHFERRMRLHGEPVYRSLFRKPESS